LSLASDVLSNGNEHVGGLMFKGFLIRPTGEGRIPILDVD
jgi:hypothetical protein